MSWVDMTRRWHDTGITNCTLCGKLIPRRLWVVDVEGHQRGFCSPDCERLYRTYWWPKYGAESGRQSVATETPGYEPGA